jgi:hypothetical protein
VPPEEENRVSETVRFEETEEDGKHPKYRYYISIFWKVTRCFLEKTAVNRVFGVVIRLRAGRSEVQIPELSHLQNGQMGCGAHPASLQWLWFFPGGKAAGA